MEERIKRIIGKIIDLKEFADREINDNYFAGQAVGLNFVLGLIYDEFPELAESEDERIRKIITDSVFYQYGADVEYKDVLDYLDKLEKHKKSLHISETCKENADSFTDEDERIRKAILGLTYIDGIEPILTKCSITAENIRAYLEKQKGTESKYAGMFFVSHEEWDTAISDAFKHGIAEGEKRKEQKPKVECDIAQPVEQDGTAEPDYGIRGNSVPGKLAAALRRHGWYLGHVGEDQRMVEARREDVVRNWPADRYSLTQERNLIMANSPQLEEQKLAEWDELQSEFKNINEAFEDGKKEVVAHPERYGLCEHAEWSEEDEIKLASLINYFEGDALDCSTEDIVRWLKSLRLQPHTVSIKDATKFGNLEYERGVKDGIQSEQSRHWKPSEEQMEAFHSAIASKAVIRDTKTQNQLEGLYNELKKLGKL